MGIDKVLPCWRTTDGLPSLNFLGSGPASWLGASRLPGTQRLGTQERHPGCPSKVATSRYIYNFLGGKLGGMMDLMTFFFQEIGFHDRTFFFLSFNYGALDFLSKMFCFVRKPISILFPFKKTPILESCSKNLWLVPWHSGKVINYAVLVWIPKTDIWVSSKRSLTWV